METLVFALEDLAHLGIEVSCGFHCSRTKAGNCSGHRQELLTYIFDRCTKVLKFFSGFIDLGKRRIGSSRLVL